MRKGFEESGASVPVVIQVVKTLDLGGAERHVVDLASVIQARGRRCVVLYSSASSTYLLDELKRNGVDVYKIPGVTQPIRMIMALWRIIDKFRPCVVHVHSPALKVAARITRIIGPFRLLTTYHSAFLRQHWAVRWTEYILHHMDDLTVSCGQEVANSYPWSTRVVPNGVPAERSRSGESRRLRQMFRISADAIVLVCVANLLENKNHSHLIGAFAEVAETECSPPPHLVLFGEGEMRKLLEHQVKEAGLEALVHFAGSDPEAADLCGEADVFCLVSKQEGLPLALLEAMRNGLPCVVSAAGEMPFVVESGRTGYVVDSEMPSQLVDALRLLMRDEMLRKNLGQRGFEKYLRDYGLNAMVDTLEGLYFDCTPVRIGQVA